jgi:hypothetical protein
MVPTTVPVCYTDLSIHHGTGAGRRRQLEFASSALLCSAAAPPSVQVSIASEEFVALSPSYLAVELAGSLKLGAYSDQFAGLVQAVAGRTASDKPSGHLKVTLSTDWLDLSMLSCLAQTLAAAQERFAEVTLDLKEPMVRRIPFLWQVGFWQVIRANMRESRLRCWPDPWDHRPQDLERSNYTPLIFVHTDNVPDPRTADARVAAGVKSWNESLQSTACFPVVSEADAIRSLEYLYLLLWELTHNAYVHSGSSTVCVAGQVLLSGTDIARMAPRPSGQAMHSPDEFFPDVRNIGRMLDALRKQHWMEVQHTDLPRRQAWLKTRKNCSFMLLSCVDSGIGIPRSLQTHGCHSTITNDQDALAAAFRPWTSTRRGDPSLFDVHGLSQILRLVRDYDGYLFVQSGTAKMEVTGDDRELRPSPVLKDMSLPGSVFQVLLPLTEEIKPSQQRGSYHGRDEGTTFDHPESATLVVFDELRRAGIELPPSEEEWGRAAATLFARAELIPGDPLYVDLVCMPRDRQFLSYILRALRRSRQEKGIVAINASREVQGIVRSLQLLDFGETTDEHIQTCHRLDLDLSSALSRGEIACLPLLLPLVSVDDEQGPIRLLWLGLSGLPKQERRAALKVLNSLYETEGAFVPWTEIWELVSGDLTTADPRAGEFIRTEFLQRLNGIARCNPAFFERTEKACRLRLTAFDLHLRSFFSLYDEVKERLIPEAKHEKDPEKHDYLYSLAWHEPGKRFRKYYYRTWPVLADRRNRNLCARLLLLKAYSVIGELIGALRAVICATPSAGLLGREIAALLGADFWEVPSIYDLDTEDWLPEIDGPVIIVDDVLDTAVLTDKMIKRLKRARAECKCVMTLLHNEDAVAERAPISCPVIAGPPVRLGRPSPAEVDAAVATGHYFEIDPHTLEPLPVAATLAEDLDPGTEKRLGLLASAGAIRSGHIVHGEHHYNLYFSLPDALATPALKDHILQWLTERILSFARQQNTTAVTVVYPYYSPIYKLVEVLMADWPVEGRDGVRLVFLVAKPRQLTSNRMGYQLAEERGAQCERPPHAVLLDDGIATGGTFASIIEELIHASFRSAMALIIFDRIGVQPRRHLKSVSSYAITGPDTHDDLAFSFMPFISVNLRSYFTRDCPECTIARELERWLPDAGVCSIGLSDLLSLVDKAVVGANPANTPSRLVAPDMLKVLAFRHTVFSDVASPRQVIEKLRDAGLSSPARLECLLTILLDSKLFRQVLDQAALHSWLSSWVGDAQIPSDLRARFILHLPMCADSPFAYALLTDTLPHAFRQLCEHDFGDVPGALTTYFDSHQVEFSAVVASLHMLHSRSKNLFGKGTTWAIPWQQALSPGEQSASEATWYAFTLGTLFAVAAQEGIYLVAHFAGKFANHAEGLVRRLRWFMGAVSQGDYEQAANQMPPETFEDLMRRIERTQICFEEFEFKKQDFTELRIAYRKWDDTHNGGELLAALRRHLISFSLLRPSTVQRLIARLAPAVRPLIDAALANYRATPQPDTLPITVEIDSELMAQETYVLGSRNAIIATVCNLLRNARQAWDKFCTGSEGVPTLHLERTVKLHAEGQFAIHIEVTDNVPSPQKDLEEFFSPESAIQMQRRQVEQWGGSLSGRLLPDGRKTFILKLQRLSRRGI